MRDRLTSEYVARARALWREARQARLYGYACVAITKYEPEALRLMRLARWIKQERTKAGVYGKQPAQRAEGLEVDV